MRIFPVILLGFGLCLLTKTGLAFSRDVYVWQRQFTPDVYGSINTIQDKIDGIAVLAAEIRWSGQEPQLFKSSVGYAQLAATGRPISVVLRIGPYTGAFARDDRTAKYLVETATEIMRTAKRQKVVPAEVQVDFDCASSKLAGYREWLEALRTAVAPTKLAFTALPDWLNRSDFPDLARAADGYVLQIHSLEKPAGIDATFQLCDPERSRLWIRQAAEVGVPFRVALPTYGYRLAFDRSGKFIALAAEGMQPPWPEGTQVRFVRANARTMAELAEEIEEEKPTNCEGIIWFRLPVPGDELNWDMITFKAVLEQRVPVSRLTVAVNWMATGRAEISLVNVGELDELLPEKIRARWVGDAPPQTIDGLGGYSVGFDSLDRNAVVLTSRLTTAGKILAPGRTRKVGWLNFNHETVLFPEILATP